MQPKTLAELARHVGGRIIGHPDTLISSAATLENARSGQITFLSNTKYIPLVKTTQAGAVIVGQEMESAADLLIAEDPYYAFMQVVVLLYGHRKHEPIGMSPQAHIAPSAHIGQHCHIHPFVTVGPEAVIGNGCILYPGVFIGAAAKLGDDCILYPNAVVYEACLLGDRVILQANATVGQDGFGYATHKGVHHKIPQIGRVILEDDVEIGSGSAIERGTLDDTVIGKGTKIGDTVTIGHGTRIGPYCLLVPQAGIAGSATLGHHCVLGGQVGVIGHIKIGNMVRIGAQAGVIGDVPDGMEIVGSPAIDSNKARRSYALIEYLPELRRSIKDIERRLRAMEKAES
ncbi:MAG: UDP-3-O-(3-hydroxymyristoyl)glucosamine N-acyltransferase [Sedimentisphaerales bacterium]|nr:UDP-3-O-(3-hydroxymyristoyl)glucosamine N-acyltransferase [Sedimentisphaerales bacterium]